MLSKELVSIVQPRLSMTVMGMWRPRKFFASPQLDVGSAIDEDIGDDIGGWCFEGTEDVSENAFNYRVFFLIF